MIETGATFALLLAVAGCWALLEGFAEAVAASLDLEDPGPPPVDGPVS